MRFSSYIPPFFLIMILVFVSGCKSDEGIDASSPCEDGTASGTYSCENFDLYAHLSAEDLGGTRLNDIWGWTDPQTNKDYALVGLTDGVSFVDISDPNSPVVIGKLEESNINAKFKVVDPSEAYPACYLGIGTTEASKNIAEGSTWRDLKVFDDHVFVVSDGQAHGMQVFDLTKLRDYDGEFLTFTHDTLYDRFANAHNIAINEQTGFAYVVGITSSEICGSRQETGLHIIDINSPLNPSFAGCYFDPETELPSAVNVGIGYKHDAQCVNYDGPDSEYSGKELCFGSAEGAVVISDVTDKNNPTTIGFSGASEMQYSHQGWLTEDHTYFLMNDEIDEGNLGRNTKTYIWDVRNLETPTFVGHYTHDTPSIDHNLYIKDNIVYQTNYTSGLRAFRIGNLANAELIPLGYFDTHPENDNVGYSGTWSNYPFFKNDVVIVSDIEDGLFILKPTF
ncbi:MAG: choice-of-anchor B family protein [Balneola sp.]|nr:MAG: choice-of-anchor B family protein [Balneola sp.]